MVWPTLGSRKANEQNRFEVEQGSCGLSAIAELLVKNVILFSF